MTATYRSEDLERFMRAVLVVLGLTAEDAAVGAAVIIDADLAGVSTHGIANFADHLQYARGLQGGSVRPRPEIKVLRDSAVAAAWDSGRGFGPVVAFRAMREAIAKAESAGIGMVTVRNGCHFGANGYFAAMAAERGQMGMVAANGMPVAFPPGGLAPAMGTNPFAFAAPVAGGPPFLLDIALTAAAGSKLVAATESGVSVPEGWVADSEGNPTTDPAALRSGGGMLPLGGPVAAHKGFGLGLMVDALGILSGSGSGIWQRYTPEWAQGQWFAAWRIDLFIPVDEFAAEMARVADHLHRIPARPGTSVTLPGERRAATRSRRRREGIPLPDRLVARLEGMGADVNVTFPRPASGD